MKKSFVLLQLTASLFAVSTGSAALISHRYSFETDANDSLGGHHGILQGSAYLQDGAVVVTGTNSSVLLPPHFLTNYSSVTVEAWFIDTPLNRTDVQIFSFNGVQGQLSYALGGQMVFRAGTASSIMNLPFPPVGGTNHLLWAQDAASQTARIFVNGQLATIQTNVAGMPSRMGSLPENRIGGGKQTITSVGGKPVTNINHNLRGKILEFRIFDGAITDLEAAVLHALGPDTVPDPDGEGLLQQVRLSIPPSVGPGALIPLKIFADFSSVTNVEITAHSELTVSSDNTNVIRITGQRMRTLGTGIAEVTASYRGVSNSISVQVRPLPGFRLAHRYSFNEVTNDWILHDSTGGAHGRIAHPGATPPNAMFTGTGELKLNGGFANLPPGILSSKSEVTVTTWFTWTQNASWQRIFDFGDQEFQSMTLGRSYFYLSPGGNGALTSSISTNSVGWENPRLAWQGNVLPLYVRSFVAIVQSAARDRFSIYVNGQRVASGRTRVQLADINDVNNWLGRSQFSWDALFTGRYDEFRIYEGALSDAEILAEYEGGPEVIGSHFALRTSVADDGLNISWGWEADGWVLESCAIPGTDAEWKTVEVSPVLSEGRYSLTVPMTSDTSFFRLRAPNQSVE